MTATPNPCDQTAPRFRLLYIFGAGGFGREVAWLAEQTWGKAVSLKFVVDDTRYLTASVNGIPVLLLSELAPSDDARFIIAVGDPKQRERIASTLTVSGHRSTTLIHPRAEVSDLVQIASGVVICANTVVTCNISIGSHVQINLACTIGHDTVVGDYCTLSPGVNVSGNVFLGRNVFVGTNACFVNGQPDRPLIVGDNAVIAAGACVTRNVDPGALVAGVPAVRKR